MTTPEDFSRAINDGLRPIEEVRQREDHFALISIAYEEFHPETFEAVTIQMPGYPPMALDGGGGPLVEMKAALDVAAGQNLPVSFASSVDNFISDLPKDSELREDLAKLRGMPQ